MQVPDDAVSVQIVMVMMVVDTVLYMLLVWYIEGVWPGRYGVAKPFYFPFQPSYWLGQRSAAACSKLRHRNERVCTPPHAYMYTVTVIMWHLRVCNCRQ